MSYILDALKKSEYARQQGKVPDLASLPVMDAGAGSPSARQRLPLLSAGAVLLAIAAAGWWRPWQAPAEAVQSPLPSLPHAVASIPAQPAVAPATAGAPEPVAPARPRTPTPQVSGAEAAPPTTTPAIAAASAAADLAASGAAASAPQVAAPPLSPGNPESAVSDVVPATPAPSQPAPAVQQASTPKRVLPELAQTPPPAAAPRAPTSAPAVPASTPTPPATAAPPKGVLDFYELPPTVRERIPALSISGYSYTAEPNMRLAVINNRVLRQGESAAPGITLERIGSDGVVLNFNGYRFRPQR